MASSSSSSLNNLPPVQNHFSFFSDKNEEDKFVSKSSKRTRRFVDEVHYENLMKIFSALEEETKKIQQNESFNEVLTALKAKQLQIHEEEIILRHEILKSGKTACDFFNGKILKIINQMIDIKNDITENKKFQHPTTEIFAFYNCMLRKFLIELKTHYVFKSSEVERYFKQIEEIMVGPWHHTPWIKETADYFDFIASLLQKIVRLLIKIKYIAIFDFETLTKLPKDEELKIRKKYIDCLFKTESRMLMMKHPEVYHSRQRIIDLEKELTKIKCVSCSTGYFFNHKDVDKQNIHIQKDDNGMLSYTCVPSSKKQEIRMLPQPAFIF